MEEFGKSHANIGILKKFDGISDRSAIYDPFAEWNWKINKLGILIFSAAAQQIKVPLHSKRSATSRKAVELVQEYIELLQQMGGYKLGEGVGELSKY